jgi:hypothetical protein
MAVVDGSQLRPFSIIEIDLSHQRLDSGPQLHWQPEIDAPGGGHRQPGDASAQRGFATAALADEAKSRSMADLEADPIHGPYMTYHPLQGPLSDRKVLADPGHGDDWTPERLVGRSNVK